MKLEAAIVGLALGEQASNAHHPRFYANARRLRTIMKTLNTLGGLMLGLLTWSSLVPAGASGVADLSLTASFSVNGPVSIYYSNLIYSITVSNAGPSAATGVVVSNQIPANVTFLSATGGATPTNGVLLVDLGSLAVGATNSIQIEVQTEAETVITNVFQVFADQTDPDLTNNTVTTIVADEPTTQFTTSWRTIETNLSSSVIQQATNYTTELIAMMPSGTVLFDQSFNTVFSDPSVQAAVTQAAGDLTAAGATSYTGPRETSLQNVPGTSSVSVTNPIGTNISAATSLYIGPKTIMIGLDQSEPFFIPAGGMDYDTLITTGITNLVTTTNTSTYLDSAVYTMTAIVAQPELGLAAVRSNQFGFTITGTSNLSIVVEACTNLASPSWTSLQICTLTNGPIYFSDPAWRRYPMRFYRTRLP
jgi:uncharacterized repeat protein (TIGR01451 family)